MLKGLSVEKTMLAFTFLFFIAVLLVVFWFTSAEKHRRIVILSGGFYISAPIDTLTALPAFESFIKKINPDHIIYEELLTPTLNLLTFTCADSVPAWYGSVADQFQKRLEKLRMDEGFDVDMLHTWRLDILQARRNFWQSFAKSASIRQKAETYKIFRMAAAETFDADTLFMDPLLINTKLFDMMRELEGRAFLKLFDNDLGVGSYEISNERVLQQIEKILGSTKAKTVLIFCNALQKYWFAEELSEITGEPVGQISQLEKQKKLL